MKLKLSLPDFLYSAAEEVWFRQLSLWVRPEKLEPWEVTGTRRTLFAIVAAKKGEAWVIFSSPDRWRVNNLLTKAKRRGLPVVSWQEISESDLKEKLAEIGG